MDRPRGGVAAAASRARLARPPDVARVLQRVARTARRHSMFEPATDVVVAVSGGPDSLCLLHSLVRLQRLFRLHLTCFHFDHRLRPGSAKDAEYVRRQASSLGVPFVLRRATSAPPKGASLEAWARDVRYEALLAVVEERGGGVAAVGHTADDQAETVLLALLRGGGLDAVAAMEPVARPLVRPLLEVTREETEAFCRALRLRPRRDPMNEDPSFLRVGVRKRILPFLERAVDRNARATLARSAELLRQDAELLDALAEDAAERVVEPSGDGRVLLRADELLALPRPLASRVVRAQLRSLGLAAASAHVDAVLSLAGSRRGRRLDLPGTLLAAREGGYVRLSRPSPGRRPSPRPPHDRTSDREGTDGHPH